MPAPHATEDRPAISDSPCPAIPTGKFIAATKHQEDEAEGVDPGNEGGGEEFPEAKGTGQTAGVGETGGSRPRPRNDHRPGEARGGPAADSAESAGQRPNGRPAVPLPRPPGQARGPTGCSRIAGSRKSVRGAPATVTIRPSFAGNRADGPTVIVRETVPNNVRDRPQENENSDPGEAS